MVNLSRGTPLVRDCTPQEVRNSVCLLHITVNEEFFLVRGPRNLRHIQNLDHFINVSEVIDVNYAPGTPYKIARIDICVPRNHKHTVSRQCSGIKTLISACIELFLKVRSGQSGSDSPEFEGDRSVYDSGKRLSAVIIRVILALSVPYDHRSIGDSNNPTIFPQVEKLNGPCSWTCIARSEANLLTTLFGGAIPGLSKCRSLRFLDILVDPSSLHLPRIRPLTMDNIAHILNTDAVRVGKEVPDVQRHELWVIPQGYNLLLLVRNLPESPQLGQIYSRYDPISEFADPSNLLLDPPTNESRRRSVDQSLLIVHHQLT